MIEVMSLFNPTPILVQLKVLNFLYPLYSYHGPICFILLYFILNLFNTDE